MIHFPRASTVCALPGTRTSLRGPISRMRPPSITMAAFRITGRPVPVITVAPWMTTSALPGCCALKIEASKRQNTTELIFHVLMFAFLEQDLNSFLRHERKHDKRAQRITPWQVHSITHQQGDEKNHREIRIAESENRGRLQCLAAELDCESLHIGAGYRNDKH